MPNGFEPEILHDFLAEAGALLDELRIDLGDLEHTPDDPDLLNKVFRALHTIKGNASFLSLTALVRVAHAAESALSAVRSGRGSVGGGTMALLLEATDVLRAQLDELGAGRELTPPREELIGALAGIDRIHAPGGPGHGSGTSRTLSALVHDGAVEAAVLDRMADEIAAVADDAASAARTPGPGTASVGPTPSTPGPTVRVEVERLDSLMEMVGELVLQKNRIGALARRLNDAGAAHRELCQQLEDASRDLDRVTADMQMGLMRTRMQPLDRLLGRYHGLVRDLASRTGKKIDLVIEGGATEVDKSVLEKLGDPVVHLMRNCADHGIEMPEDRVKAGKPESGTITIRVRHAGSRLGVQIRDDGRGLCREKISARAVQHGLTTPGELAGLSDHEVYRLILAPGLSTAERAGDLSGRGVGMDVVSTNVAALGGTLDIDSAPGRGTTIDITIPLTVGAVPALLVDLGDAARAAPGAPGGRDGKLEGNHQDHGRDGSG